MDIGEDCSILFRSRLGLLYFFLLILHFLSWYSVGMLGSPVPGSIYRSYIVDHLGFPSCPGSLPGLAMPARATILFPPAPLTAPGVVADGVGFLFFFFFVRWTELPLISLFYP